MLTLIGAFELVTGLCLVALLVGLISPRLIGMRRRRSVVQWVGGGSLVSAVLVGSLVSLALAHQAPPVPRATSGVSPRHSSTASPSPAPTPQVPTISLAANHDQLGPATRAQIVAVPASISGGGRAMLNVVTSGEANCTQGVGGVGLDYIWAITKGLPSHTLIELGKLITPGGTILISNNPATTQWPMQATAGGFYQSGYIAGAGTLAGNLWSLVFPNPKPPGVTTVQVQFVVLEPSGQVVTVTSQPFMYPTTGHSMSGCALSFMQAVDANYRAVANMGVIGTAAPLSSQTVFVLNAPLAPLPPSMDATWQLEKVAFVATNGPTVSAGAAQLNFTAPVEGFEDITVGGRVFPAFIPDAANISPGTQGTFVFWYNLGGGGATLLLPVFSPVMTIPSNASPSPSVSVPSTNPSPSPTTPSAASVVLKPFMGGSASIQLSYPSTWIPTRLSLQATHETTLSETPHQALVDLTGPFSAGATGNLSVIFPSAWAHEAAWVRVSFTTPEGTVQIASNTLQVP